MKNAECVCVLMNHGRILFSDHKCITFGNESSEEIWLFYIERTNRPPIYPDIRV